jgi:hypothetical protein
VNWSVILLSWKMCLTMLPFQMLSGFKLVYKKYSHSLFRLFWIALYVCVGEKKVIFVTCVKVLNFSHFVPIFISCISQLQKICKEELQTFSYIVCIECRCLHKDYIINIFQIKNNILLTYSMEQSPSWEPNWFAASQEIPCFLWNPKVHHRTHKRPLPVPFLCQPNPVLTPTSHFLKIHSNIILPSKPGSPQRSLSFRFPHQTPVHTFPSPILATCPAHLLLPDFITRTILGKEYRPFSSSLGNFLHSKKYLF